MRECGEGEVDDEDEAEEEEAGKVKEYRIESPSGSIDAIVAVPSTWPYAPLDELCSRRIEQLDQA